MADFRRCFIALAVLALMAGAVSAQVGVANGSASSSLLACVATAAGTPELRPEGYTELAGDIVISCTGGPNTAVNSVVNTTNIVIYMAPGVPITSRFMSSNGASEALLIIDEAGSNIPTGATGGYGPKAVQNLCTTTQQFDNGGPNNQSSCTPYVGVDGSGTYAVSVLNAPTVVNNVLTPSIIPAKNVYQGKIGDFGANSVAFYNVPVLPPSTSGVTRTFRITNIRVPVAGQNLTGTLQAIVSTSPSQTLPVSGTALNIGVVGPSMNAAVRNTVAFTQCQPQTRQLTANLTFTEGFATGFKTRVVPGGIIPVNTAYAAEATNTTPGVNNQNIPGGLYNGFAANSESGLIYPGLTGVPSSGSTTTYTAGLADYGTRLKAVFYNIPAGLTLYVSTTSAAQTAVNFVPGGTSVLPYAVLVATNSGEATADGSAFGTASGSPIATTGTGSDGLGSIAISADATGKAVAVWEVTNANPSAQDAITFSVYISYVASSATATNPYGLPITDLPLGAPVNDVQLSMAPEPGGGTFTAAALQGTSLPIPRFAVIKTLEGRFTAINLCQTTLLYPFVTGAAGFDTGIAVANTSMDPFGTINQTGSCKLYGYGVTVAAAGNTALQTTVPGCDTLANPLEGTNCFGIVPSGQVKSVMASAVLTNFQGYVIAVCNFQYAHGYAAVTDLGLRNLWSSYLALELTPGGVGSPRKGIAGIENLVH